MLARLLSCAPNLPDVWGEGALFAFSGLDGETNVTSGFVATYSREPYGLLFHTPRRRFLDVEVGGPAKPSLATGDVCAVETAGGELVVAFSAWHTIAGTLPASTRLRLRLEAGPAAVQRGAYRVSVAPDGRDALALGEREGRFALAYGRTAGEACQRVEAGLAADVEVEATARLAIYRRLPTLADSGLDRLLKKCFSVMKVNTLSPEGCIRQIWSTPDRVPHRDMWLWDSVFHALGMNPLLPEVGWDDLKSMLDTQDPDGAIWHQASVDGRKSSVTQPPLLAWGVWENYQALPDPSHLDYALPRLEGYLEWDLAHRDQNGNGLLEWLLSDDPRCRCGESGLDNSPRFDRAVPMDHVDFSAYAAQDMAYVSRIAQELGMTDKAEVWRERSRAMSGKIHAHLWNEQMGFYCDRDLEGHFSPVRAVSGFLPLLLDDIPTEHVERLVQALLDPNLFNTAFPVPSLAVSEPSWSTDMWRGPTWLNTNYLIIEGLRRRGKLNEARWLAEKTIAFALKYYREYGVLFEFYDAKDQIPPLACDRKGPRREPYDIRRKSDSIRDYHFTASLTARLLLDRIAEEGAASYGPTRVAKR